MAQQIAQDGMQVFGREFEAHRKTHPNILSTFGDAWCREEGCDWHIGLSFEGGNPFNPNSSRPTIWTCWLNGKPVGGQ